MSVVELTTEQEEIVSELRLVLAHFAAVLERCRDEDLRVVDAFRAAGVEIPGWVPSPLLENLLASS